jgi:putative transposase
MSCWLSFALDSSVNSMRGFFKKLNLGGQSISQSTFSKAINHRSTAPFQELYKSLNKFIKEKHQPKKEWDICPIDSTTITLTSKLLWALGHHQVKLFNAISHETYIPQVDIGVEVWVGFRLSKTPSSKDFELKPELLA